MMMHYLVMLKKGGGRGEKVMDRCARLEVRIERKWKLRTGFISDWIKFFFFFASPSLY